jgi:hypothetical protein
MASLLVDAITAEPPAMPYALNTGTRDEITSMINRPRRSRDEVGYWAFTVYLRFLTVIADIGEFFATHPREEVQRTHDESDE